MGRRASSAVRRRPARPLRRAAPRPGSSPEPSSAPFRGSSGCGVRNDVPCVAGPVVDLVLLRGLFSDTALKPGTVLAARVLERDGPRGMLLLNGVRVPAQLPPELAEGDALRVRVAEATAERLHLQVVQQGSPSAPAASTPAAAYTLVLPGGAQARVMVEPEGEGSGGAVSARRSITLRFDSPALGRMDFVLDLDATALAATIHAIAGDPAALARAESSSLQSALSAATDRPATVTIRERGETLDVRA